MQREESNNAAQIVRSPKCIQWLDAVDKAYLLMTLCCHILLLMHSMDLLAEIVDGVGRRGACIWVTIQLLLHEIYMRTNPGDPALDIHI